MNEEEEGLAAMDPRRAMCIRVALDVFAVVYLLFFIGGTTMIVRASKNWWDSLPFLLFFTPISVWTLWMTAKRKGATKHALGSEPSTKLLIQ